MDVTNLVSTASANARAAAGHGAAAGDQPITMIRQYRSAREYQDDAARLCRSGWEIISVLDRGPLPNRLDGLTLGLTTLFRTPAREFLVTYTWLQFHGGAAPRFPSSQRKGARLLAAARRWWWVGAILGLGAGLVLGIASFLGS